MSAIGTVVAFIVVALAAAADPGAQSTPEPVSLQDRLRAAGFAGAEPRGCTLNRDGSDNWWLVCQTDRSDGTLTVGCADDGAGTASFRIP